ncbi:hypothetical protein L1887_36530 [Cichorium endivia]|nr:hypothetical protein L1887_36530 [Cichorium endivia]
MAGVEDSLEIKFRLNDGSDIGPKSFPLAANVASLKESIISQWPKEKDNAPRTVEDVKLINGGKILENITTIGECKSSFPAGGIITMHVLINHVLPPQGKAVKFKRMSHHATCWGWATKRTQAPKV